MRLALDFDEKKIVAMICTLDAEQAQMFLDAMKKNDKSVELVPVLEEIVHRGMGEAVSRESRIAG